MNSERRGIITPEAVLLEFETAGLGSRLWPALLDLAIQLVVMFLLLLGFGFVTGVGGGVGSTAAIVILLLMSLIVLVGYPACMEAFWDGRTLGKAAGGLRVITKEGAPITFRHSGIRAIARLFEVILTMGAIAVLVSLLNRDSQRLGDVLAGTIVVRERKATTESFPVVFAPPQGYEAYVATLDVSGLTAEQYGIVRSFLLRVHEFTPEARAALAVKIANPVAERLSHTPPPMVNPELFLVSVAAAYQLRHAPDQTQHVSPQHPDLWAAAQAPSGQWTGTSPAWPGAGPHSGPAPPPPVGVVRPPAPPSPPPPPQWGAPS